MIINKDNYKLRAVSFHRGLAFLILVGLLVCTILLSDYLYERMYMEKLDTKSIEFYRDLIMIFSVPFLYYAMIVGMLVYYSEKGFKSIRITFGKIYFSEAITVRQYRTVHITLLILFFVLLIVGFLIKSAQTIKFMSIGFLICLTNCMILFKLRKEKRDSLLLIDSLSWTKVFMLDPK